MKDFFEVLKFERAPWLTAEEVNARFLELSAAAHPDKVHAGGDVAAANAKFAELNAASACLRDPRARLQHLIELEGAAPQAAAQNSAAEMIDLFTRVGQMCREVDQFLNERGRATSPMMQAQLFAKGLDWTDRIEEIQRAVAEKKLAAEGRLRAIHLNWPNEKPLGELARLAHAFATIGRWENQLKERYAALAAG